MQASANSNLILTDLSSFKPLAGLHKDISHAAFHYQIISELMRGVYRKQTFSQLGNTLVALAQHSYSLRLTDAVEKASDFLLNLPLGPEYQSVGRYYQALCIYRRGEADEARILLERVAGSLPLPFRAKARLAMSGICYESGDLHSFLLLNLEASRLAACSDWRDPQTFVKAQRNIAVLKSVDGDHRGALADLERLFPLARALGRWQPYLYYEHLNSLAVELMETASLEEAQNASEIALASLFAGASPEWQETRDEIELRRRRPSRSVVAFHRASADPAFNRKSPEANNLLLLPVPDRSQSLAARPSLTTPPARVLSLQAWKKRMPNPSIGNPQHETTPKPTTHKQKQDTVKKLQKLTTREMLLRIMKMIGDERVGDDLLLRALIILEDLETDNNQRR